MNFKKISYLLLGMVFALSLWSTVTMAAEFRVAKKSGSIIIDKELKNLYAAGNIVSINADIEKSLYVAGNVITINGNVENNVNAVGSAIVIKGDIGSTVHLVAGNILIEGTIEDDLFSGGGTITLAESSLIGGDLIIGGGVVEIKGPVTGDIHLSGDEVFIDSKISGNVSIKAGAEVRLGGKAEIIGNLKYSSTKEMIMDKGAKVLGEIAYEQINIGEGGLPNKHKVFASILALGFLIKLLTTIVAGLVLVYLFKSVARKVVRESLNHFWTNLSRGFGLLILIPIVCIILVITILGLALAGLIGATYALMLPLASILASIVFGSWLIKVLGKRPEYLVDWKAVVVGTIALSFITLIPFVGWFVEFLFLLTAMGAIYQLVRKNITQAKPKT